MRFFLSPWRINRRQWGNILFRSFSLLWCGGGTHCWISDEYQSAEQGQYCDVISIEFVFLWEFHDFVWEEYIGYCKGIILKHYEGAWRRKALCSKNNAPRDVIPSINLMQLFTLHRMVPSIWLKRQCLGGNYNGKYCFKH